MTGPGQEDRMTLTVLEDGTARLEVEGISGANHVRAEALVKEFARLMGGPMQMHKDPHAHAEHHHHEGQEEHDHQH